MKYSENIRRKVEQHQSSPWKIIERCCPRSLILIGAIAAQVATGQTIDNPSFEADAYAVWPGYVDDNGGSIAGWTVSNPGTTGLNPATGTPFADNGTPPHGTNVAFIQFNGELSTTITGLTPGSAYQVSFRANSRGATARIFPDWSLNEEDYRPFTAYPAVGGVNPYYLVSRSFVATSPTAKLGIRNRSISDAALLVDDFQITAVARLTVTTANDSGAGSLREAVAHPAPAKHIDFDPILNGSTITLSSGELAKGTWQTLPWTGDADSGLNAALPYTHAINFFDFNYSGDVSPTINGVHFTGLSAIEFVNNNGLFPFYKFDLLGADNIVYADSNAIMDQVSGNSRYLASDKLVANNAFTLKLYGLTVGKTYRTSFYCVGDAEFASRLLSVTVNGIATELNEKAFGYLQGARFVYEFLATSEAQTFAFQKTTASNLALYGFSNAEVASLPPTQVTIDASPLPDGITLSANNSSRFFSVEIGSSLNLEHISMINGGPQGSSDGGAIYNLGRIAVRDGLLQGNTAGHYGGAFYNKAGGIMDIDLCRIDANAAVFAGGIINYGSATVTRSTVSGHATAGIYNNGPLAVGGSTFTGNTSTDFGSGIYNTGDLQITNSTFTNNHSGYSGGAIYHDGPALNLVHCTVSGNSSDTTGGGVRSLQNCIIHNTIIAHNSATSSLDFEGALGATSSGNLIGDGMGMTGISNGVNANQVGGSGASRIDPKLAPLGAAGGPTQTMLPIPGSLAIDAGLSSSLGFDQRDATRMADGDGNGSILPDIGAAELTRYVVTSNADSGAGSLRHALQGGVLADLVAFNTIPGDGTVFDGSPSSRIDLTSPLVVANATVNIDASGIPNGVNLRGEGTHRILSIDAVSRVQAHSLTLENGFGTGAEEDGGAVHNEGSFTAINSRFLHNTTDHYGGGIYNGFGANLSLTECTVSENTSPFAGGILNFGTAVINSSTISRNSNIGIYSFTSLVLTNSTIAENTAVDAGSESGAGIYNAIGTLSLDQCTVAGNAGAEGAGGISSNTPVTLKNTIVAGNRSSVTNDFSGAVAGFSVGNLIGDGTGLTGIAHGSNGNQIGTGTTPIDPLLAPLGEYGGPTQTMALLVGSPAINAVSTPTQLKDQRGNFRFGLDDIGSHEAGVIWFVTNTNDSGAGSLRQALTDANLPGARILFLLDSSDTHITLTSGELAIPSNSSFFIDASRLVDNSGNPNTAPHPAIPGAVVFPGGVTVDGGSSLRLLNIPSGSTLALQRLTLANGNVTGNGGCILNEGSLTVIDSTLHGGEVGGGQGGAIFGGPGSSTAIHRSTLHGNHALEGGAIFSSGQLDLAFSTLTDNLAGNGGALHCGGQTRLRHVTLTANSANSGGGIYNSGGRLELGNSIVSENTASQGKDVVNNNAALLQIGQNLIRGMTSLGTSSFSGTTAITTAPELFPLADNGGPTLTMEPKAYSPAINAVPGGAITPFADQRGFPLQLGAGLDAGAFESATGNYTSTGLTLFGSVPQALLAAGTMSFEISADPYFLGLVKTVSGTGTFGATNGPLESAEYGYPAEIAQDSTGNYFIADAGNNRIRMITPDGTVSTIAGTGGFGLINGDGDGAKFAAPSGIVVADDDNLYVADTLNHCIRKLVRPQLAGNQWQVSTLAGFGTAGFQDGTGLFTQFHHPHGLALDSSGSLFVADTGNHRIRKVTPDGVVTTWAGTGAVGTTNSQRLLSKFSAPYGLAFDSSNVLYVADTGNKRIRRIGLDNLVTTLAGDSAGFADGLGLAAAFRSPAGLAVDAAGNLYVADQENHAVRKMNRPANPLDPWLVETLGGTGSAGFADGRSDNLVAKFNRPTGICVTQGGALLIADQKNNAIRTFTYPVLVEAIAGSVSPLGQSMSATLDSASNGLEAGTRYYFRWVAGNGSRQISGQTFVLQSAPANPGTPFRRWQVKHFGADAEDPLIAGALANPRGDGVVNLNKYGFGLDPGEVTDSLPITMGRNGGLITLTYPQIIEATDITYNVEWSTDLIHWSREDVIEETLGTNSTSREILATAPATTEPRQFVRISINLP